MSISTDIQSSHYSARGDHILTRALWRIALGEPELVQLAIAWVIRNRIARHILSPVTFGDAPLTKINQCAIDKVCEEVIAEAAPCANQAPDHPGEPDGADPDASSFLQVQEVAQRVWRGDFSDPTDGATRCCRHDREPLWSSHIEPKALLGSFLFYP